MIPAARLTYRESVAIVGCGVWMIIGLFVDGWAHENSKPETFFTPWHALLYSGFLAAVLVAVSQLRSRHETGRRWRDTVPEGQALTLLALGVFAAGAIGDLAWHQAFGIEVGVEALLSPTHLVLLAGGLVALTSPLRAAWSDPSPTSPRLRSFLPPLLSLTLATALVGFFLLYLSPFIVDTAGTAFKRVPGEHVEHGKETLPELRQLLGVASILVTTVLFVVPTQLLLRRWQPPLGTFTLFLGVVVALFVGLHEFSQPPLALTGFAAGFVLDALVRRRIPPWLLGAALPVALWSAYFAIYQLAYGVKWTIELWAGVTVLATLIGLVLGIVISLPGIAAGGTTLTRARLRPEDRTRAASVG